MGLLSITGLVLGAVKVPSFPVLGIQVITLILTCFKFSIIPIVIIYISDDHGIDLKIVE